MFQEDKDLHATYSLRVPASQDNYQEGSLLDGEVMQGVWSQYRIQVTIQEVEATVLG